MERVAAQGSGADEIANQESFVLAYAGELRQARKMSQRAAQLALRNSQAETASLWEIGAALQESFLGNSAAAKQNAMKSLDLSKDREVEYGAALALALSGDSARAEGLANDLERRFPEDTSVRFSYLPTLHALLALSQGQPSKAIDLLQVATLDELGQPRSSIHGFFGALYPVYGSMCGARPFWPYAKAPQWPRSSRKFSITAGCGQRSHRGTAALAIGPLLRSVGREREGEDRLPRFPHALEERRSRHPHSETSESGVREAPVTLVP
jgi:hypothetical protein